MTYKLYFVVLDILRLCLNRSSRYIIFYFWDLLKSSGTKMRFKELQTKKQKSLLNKKKPQLEKIINLHLWNKKQFDQEFWRFMNPQNSQHYKIYNFILHEREHINLGPNPSVRFFKKTLYIKLLLEYIIFLDICNMDFNKETIKNFQVALTLLDKVLYLPICYKAYQINMLKQIIEEFQLLSEFDIKYQKDYLKQQINKLNNFGKTDIKFLKFFTLGLNFFYNLDLIQNHTYSTKFFNLCNINLIQIIIAFVRSGTSFDLSSEDCKSIFLKIVNSSNRWVTSV